MFYLNASTSFVLYFCFFNEYQQTTNFPSLGITKIIKYYCCYLFKSHFPLQLRFKPLEKTDFASPKRFYAN